MRQLRVATLPVMHDGYRLPAAAMRELVALARAGQRFEPVHVTRFEDGRVMLRDGLHRSTAIMPGRPSGMLDESEVVALANLAGEGLVPRLRLVPTERRAG